jgi:two-component system, NarL family, nitrate/nitrite response regulator NarL
MKALLIDDHALFRMGLQELLQRRGVEVVGATGCPEEGIRWATARQPDIILLDMRLPDTSGNKILASLRESGILLPVLILTTSKEENDLVEALKIGAQGYLLKDMDPDQLLTAMQDIVSGQTVVAPDLTAVLAKAVQANLKKQTQVERFADLTPRESEILCHLASGESNKIIARELSISDGTVKLHVKAILRKLEVHSRVEAAVIAVENSLCS